ncbi:4-alpha-glucanotransferase [Clostridia bacterium]|nr:4-alpha-glucanotransferase [Clostridia bacterium]
MRNSGILMHISSLPSPYGIGTMGKEARSFVDFLVQSAQKYWQVLPLCPTGNGDSPYQSFSGFAGNPYFIDLDYLCEEELLTKEECESFVFGTSDKEVDYGALYENRYPLFHKAFARFKKNIPEDFHAFCGKQEAWLSDYALFMALKDKHEGVAWSKWEKDLKTREPQAIAEAKEELKEEICFWQMLQYFFYKQWFALKAYANRSGVEIIGDVPIYVAGDSADVWADPAQFYLDDNLDPIDVAGCPPDAFTAEGQLWGNPLFRWDTMKEDGFAWWKKRIAHMSVLYDVIRIDHFRGFDSYYAIPYGSVNAVRGEWRTGPGMDLFTALKEGLGDLNIIVEDLGFLTPSVLQLVADSGFPGMKLMQFAFDSRDGDYLPHNYQKHCVVYTGTHDNDTILGWLKSASKESVAYAKEYMCLNEEEGYHWGMMRTAWASVSNLAIVTMQDVLGLSGEARMNVPSTLGGNWMWRMEQGGATDDLAKKIKQYMNTYARVPR